MNAKLTKLISSAAVVLAMGSSVSAQNSNQGNKACPCPPFEQGMGLTNCEKFPAAYNAPARTEVKCSWDVFATASFIYWYEDQEGMEVGVSTAQPIGGNGVPTNSYFPAQGGQFAVPHFKYKPGFKVGMGFNCDFDNWVAFAEYTWLHGTTTTSFGATTDPRGAGVFKLNNWYNVAAQDAASATGYAGTASNIGTKWRLNLDMVDATLSRPFYQGRKLTMSPFAGVRAAWVRQNYRIAAQIPATTPTAAMVVSHNNSHNWGVGPRAGMLGHWLLGWGFRVEGDMGLSVLFTRFNVHHREDTVNPGTASNATPAGTSYTTYKYYRYNTVRPWLDLGMGLGWGTYLDCQNYHLDILANYDFNVLWGQNAMRKIVDAYQGGGGGEPSDLHYQGLTLTVRFDF